MRLSEEETICGQPLPVVVFRFGGHHVPTNYYAVRLFKLCRLGHGAEQARSTASSYQSNIDADGATAERHAGAIEHDYRTAYNDWPTDSDYHQSGGRNRGRTANAKYSGHNPARDDSWDNAGNDSAKSERTQYAGSGAVRSSAGNSGTEWFCV